MTDDGTGDGAPKKLSDAWIFVSHSNKDLDGIRRVRDEFERLGAFPILFFLKSVNDHDKLHGLIKDEIEVRNFFVYCHSKNTDASTWVQDELALARAIGREIHHVELSDTWDKQQEAIGGAVRAATTFLSYAHRDRDRVQPYIDLLIAFDFAVYDSRRVMFSEYGLGSEHEVEAAIEDSAKAGHFVVFVTRDWLASRWGQAEVARYRAVSRAIDHSTPAVFVVLDPFEAPGIDWHGLNVVDATRGGVAENGPALLRALGLKNPAEPER